MSQTLASALFRNFLGNAPAWYKAAIVAFTHPQPARVLRRPARTCRCGLAAVIKFIFSAGDGAEMLSVRPGGLLVIEAVLIGLTTPQSVYTETVNAFPVVLLSSWWQASTS